MLVCVACTRVCQPYPTDRRTYMPLSHGQNEILIYYAMNENDTVYFDCQTAVLSNTGKQPYCQKCLCEISARQTLTSEDGRIEYEDILHSSGKNDHSDWASRSDLIISCDAFGLSINGMIYTISETGDAGILPEWTAADGTRYTDVYHIDDEASDAMFYLAPGYGIVQAVTPDKTYVLKTE